MKTNQSIHPPVLLGNGSLHRLEELLIRLDAKTVFLVADESAYKFSGAAQVMDPVLQSRHTTWFTEFALNPKIADVERGVALVRNTRPDAVIALGGGSAIDMAKLIAGCGSQEGEPADYGKRLVFARAY